MDFDISVNIDEKFPARGIIYHADPDKSNIQLGVLECKICRKNFLEDEDYIQCLTHEVVESLCVKVSLLEKFYHDPKGFNNIFKKTHGTTIRMCSCGYYAEFG